MLHKVQFITTQELTQLAFQYNTIHNKTIFTLKHFGNNSTIFGVIVSDKVAVSARHLGFNVTSRSL